MSREGMSVLRSLGFVLNNLLAGEGKKGKKHEENISSCFFPFAVMWSSRCEYGLKWLVPTSRRDASMIGRGALPPAHVFLNESIAPQERFDCTSRLAPVCIPPLWGERTFVEVTAAGDCIPGHSRRGSFGANKGVATCRGFE